MTTVNITDFVVAFGLINDQTLIRDIAKEGS